MNLQFKRLLFIGPHPDDVELGCGGLIAKNSRSNHTYYTILSPCREEPKNEKILSETRKATYILGIPEKHLIINHLPRRILYEQRDKVRRTLIDVKKKVKPDLVFCPSLRDIHQDHAVIAEETFRLFREVSVFCYENPRSSVDFRPNLYVPLSEEHLKQKIEALMCYQSQFDRYYFNEDVLRSFAQMRGAQCRVPYAEAYEILRLHG